MSTRAQVRFATREPGVSFNEHPDKINAQFYVHNDGYPEGLGCQIAESLTKYGKLNNWELEHVDIRHGDLEYIYYVWQDHGKDIWISIFSFSYADARDESCIFVGRPEELLNRFDERRIACKDRGYCVNSTQSDMDQGVDPEFCNPRGCGRIQKSCFSGEVCDGRGCCECVGRDPDLCGTACCQNTN